MSKNIAEVLSPSMKAFSGIMQTSPKSLSSTRQARTVATPATSSAYAAAATGKRISAREAPYGAAPRGQHPEQSLLLESSTLATDTKKNPDTLKCVSCEKVKSRNGFDPIMLERLTKNRNLYRAKCKDCAKDLKEEENSFLCTICNTKKVKASFVPQKLTTWKKNRDIGRCDKCLFCEAKDPQEERITYKEESRKCVSCKKVKSRNEYDPIMLQRWTKNRELAKKAECKNCAAARGIKKREPKRNWLWATYKCSKCEIEYSPKHFAYATLASLEADKQTFLAVCLHCNPVIYETHASLKPVTCVACKKLKDRKEFTIERQRCSTLATR